MSTEFMATVYSTGGKTGAAAKTARSQSRGEPAKDFLELLKRSSESPKPEQTAAPKDIQADSKKQLEETDTPPKAETGKTEDTQESEKEQKPVLETNLQAMMAAIMNVSGENVKSDTVESDIPAEAAGVPSIKSADLQELQNVLTPQPEQKNVSEQPQMQPQEPVKEVAGQFAMQQKTEVAVEKKVSAGERLDNVKTDETSEVQKQDSSTSGLNSQLNLLKSRQEEKGMRQNMGNSLGQQTEKTKTDENKQLEELKSRADAGNQELIGRLSQAKVNTGFTVKEAVSQTEVQTPVLEQVKSGLEQGMKDQLKEFTLKLKPEGLGEIVVRMVSTGGKVGVHIGVSNPETEKLISSQMAGLKEMLEPLHAHVEEVYHNSQNSMGFAGFGQDMDKGQQQSETARYHSVRRGPAQEDTFDAEAEKMLVESRLGRLYAYV